MNEIDRKFIKKTIKLAENAYKNGEVPVGAVIVKAGKIISKAYNRKEEKNIVTQHAEIIAIEKASKKLSNWRLNGCIIYVSLEPCKMCAGAIEEARIEKVVYAAKTDKVYKNKISKKSCIKDELLIKKSELLIKKFFKEKR